RAGARPRTARPEGGTRGSHSDQRGYRRGSDDPLARGGRPQRRRRGGRPHPERRQTGRAAHLPVPGGGDGNPLVSLPSDLLDSGEEGIVRSPDLAAGKGGAGEGVGPFPDVPFLREPGGFERRRHTAAPAGRSGNRGAAAPRERRQLSPILHAGRNAL